MRVRVDKNKYMWCKDEIQIASTNAGNAVSGGLGMRRMFEELTQKSAVVKGG